MRSFGCWLFRDQLDARIAEVAGAFDAHELWDIDGATSMTAWLRSMASMTDRWAKRLSVLAPGMRQLPVCAAAYGDGSLSGGQVEAILAQVDDSTVGAVGGAGGRRGALPGAADRRRYITGHGRLEGPRHRNAGAGRARAPALPVPDPRRRYVLDGSFDAEGGAVVATALRLATPTMPTTPAPGAKRADALVDVCRFFLDHQHRGRGPAPPPPERGVDLDAWPRAAGAGSGGPALDGASVSASCATAPCTGC